ncbi:hypothetical protein M441DRAFT_354411 [Trichoderma asperellum CBS 433.97]|uniref:Uncharacterized protein n=1 Tax=Trichoderma asperellum (strain ATCC 204424 / CBS 433.97 / NBRC 101777) TaxID=1042311 RepID=A0A2T3ZIV2_TRIA4|nr:hypothetical protein M441DRAFT_354411 [Trichoderma asperellum CBS 433.97]PTB44712.1 hypothetical protein M441DRAFT_354411 [Trichoderma asperellum CBS 433.97]
MQASRVLVLDSRQKQSICIISPAPCLAFLVLLCHVTPRVKLRQKQHLHAPMLLPFLRKKGLKPP